MQKKKITWIFVFGFQLFEYIQSFHLVCILVWLSKFYVILLFFHQFKFNIIMNKYQIKDRKLFYKQ